MKCVKCGTENAAGAAYCKKCGRALKQEYKTCKNGHNFDASLDVCPFCPSADRTISGAKTQVEDAFSNRDKTVVDIGAPKLSAQFTPPPSGGRSDKTMIYGVTSSKAGVSGAGIRKLVGWLITYDINPAGVDFKLFVGRHKIGRSNSSDIVIQQPGVSDDHAVLLYRDDTFILQDMLSTNGTFVNEEPIDDKVVLKNDDIIRVGSINLKLKTI